MHNISTENDEISLKELIEKIKDYFNYVLLYWKSIFIVVVFGALLGLTYSFFKKPVYTATLTFALEDEKSGGGLGSALGIASTLGLDIGGGSSGGIFTGANLTELLKSRSMVEKALLTSVSYKDKNISLAEMYIENNNLREKWKKYPQISNIQFLPNSDRKNFSRVQDSIFGVFYNDLSKNGLLIDQKDKKVSIIAMDVSSDNELFAKYFCESLAKEVGKFYIQTKSKKARLNMDILQRQVDSVRGELNGSITGVAIANDNTFNLNPAMNVRKAPSARRQVDVQANTAILTELVKQSELAKVTLRKDTPLIQVIDAPILPLPKQVFSKAKGIVMGGILSGFLFVSFIVIRRIINQL